MAHPTLAFLAAAALALRFAAARRAARARASRRVASHRQASIASIAHYAKNRRDALFLGGCLRFLGLLFVWADEC